MTSAVFFTAEKDMTAQATRAARAVTLQSRIKSGPITPAPPVDGAGIRSESRANSRCNASMARSPLNLGFDLRELILAAAAMRG
jgi:hypothetical protein